MLPWTVLGLALSLRLARSGAERGPPASAPQGDLLFLLDSSASVSHYEFSRVREFLGRLAALLPLGPGALRASLVHVGSRPHTEFPFGQHSSGSAIQDAIHAAAQRMGDTNHWPALAYAKEQLFAKAAGARPGVPKVLVWVTDGGSSDPRGAPHAGAEGPGRPPVFVVSTGRGNLLELSAAASRPPLRSICTSWMWMTLHIINPGAEGLHSRRDVAASAPCLRGYVQRLPSGLAAPTDRRLGLLPVGAGAQRQAGNGAPPAAARERHGLGLGRPGPRHGLRRGAGAGVQRAAPEATAPAGAHSAGGDRAGAHRHLARQAAQPARELGPGAGPGRRARLPRAGRAPAGRRGAAHGGARGPEQHHAAGPGAGHRLPGDRDGGLPLRPREGAVGQGLHARRRAQPRPAPPVAGRWGPGAVSRPRPRTRGRPSPELGGSCPRGGMLAGLWPAGPPRKRAPCSGVGPPGRGLA
uniref:VWFA domain-containing protein n=1 Tax=Phocoena sinus TaxID=42100 RepID=A0A8C9B4N4_PHOSS